VKILINIVDALVALQDCFWLFYFAKNMLNVTFEKEKYWKYETALIFIGYVAINLLEKSSPYVVILLCVYMISILCLFGKSKLFVTTAVVVVYHIIMVSVNAFLFVTSGVYWAEYLIVCSAKEIDWNYIVLRILYMAIWLLINLWIHKGIRLRELKYKKIYLGLGLVFGLLALVWFLSDFMEISTPWLIYYVAYMKTRMAKYKFLDAFSDYAMLFMLLNIIYGMYAIFTYKKVWKEREIVSERNRLLEEKYTQLNDYYTANAKIYHDMNSHLQAIRYISKKYRVHEILEYVDGIETGIGSGVVSTWTGLGVVDAILSENSRKAKKQGIDFKINAEMIPQNISIENWELCSIFSNLLNNCMEANPTKVRIYVKMVGHMFFIRTQNDYVGERKKVKGWYESSKKDGKHRGWGLRNIEEITQKYGGNLGIQDVAGMFCVDVMLNIH